jgi:hypothetical protein
MLEVYLEPSVFVDSPKFSASLAGMSNITERAALYVRVSTAD